MRVDKNFCFQLTHKKADKLIACLSSYERITVYLYREEPFSEENRLIYRLILWRSYGIIDWGTRNPDVIEDCGLKRELAVKEGHYHIKEEITLILKSSKNMVEFYYI